MKLALLLLGRFVFLFACWTAVLLAAVFVGPMTKLIHCLPSGARRRRGALTTFD